MDAATGTTNRGGPADPPSFHAVMMPSAGFLLFNAGSGSARRYTPAQFLDELPPGTRLHEFAAGDDPVAIARQAVSEGVAWIAVAGGDGTVEAIAAALVDTPTPLGIIACGTYNNFARSARIPPDPLEAARLIRAGATRQIDVGFVNGHPFFECVGVGLDAALFPLGEQIKEGGFLKWFELLRTAVGYERQVFDLALDRPFREALTRAKEPPRRSRGWWKWFQRTPAQRVRLKALMITVSNGPYYGANFAVAPDAQLDDGRLTITVFKKYNKLELWWHFYSISAGRRVYAPRVVTMNAREVEISGPRPLDVHRDGSPLAEWPVRIELAPRRLWIFGPPPA